MSSPLKPCALTAAFVVPLGLTRAAARSLPDARALAALLAVPLVLVLAAPMPARAHPLGLGALLVVERDDGALDVTLRLSPDEAGVARPELVPGGGCTLLGRVVRGAADAETLTRALRMRCSGEGAHLDIDGLAGSDVRVLATVRRRGAAERRVVIDPDDARLELDADATSGDGAFIGTMRLGAEHVAFGVDHLLFVLGLLALSRTPRRLVLCVTGFTVGHSVTLALATLGAIDVPRAPVEIVIALSLVFVALEIARPADAPQTLSARAPWLVAGAFGLVHGLGFASALGDLGLTEGRLLVSLVGFNVGVELGQLAFVALVLGVARVAAPAVAPARQQGIAAHAIGAAGVYLVLDRTVARVVELLA